IAHAVGVVSRFMHQPQVAHMNAALRIVRRSTSGYFSLVGGNLVTWRSKKQKVVSLSSAEADFRENPVQHDRRKHVEVNRHFIKEKLEAGIIELPFVKSSNQLADILTKAATGVAPGTMSIQNSTVLVRGSLAKSSGNTLLKLEDEDLALLLLTSLPASYKVIRRIGDNGEGLYVRGRIERRIHISQGKIQDQSLKVTSKKTISHPSGSINDGSEVMSAEALQDRFMDSGGSYHMTPKLDLFFEFLKCDGASLLLGDNRECKIRGIRVQHEPQTSLLIIYG
nr:uncharacterized mitochondrial protein AtMg00810-like [Tanacetum cinerariifolium]